MASAPMTAAAVRRFADANSARIADIPADQRIRATIDGVTPGAAKDGNARVTVNWRGAPGRLVNGYAASYTPVVGHQVICDLIDNQLFVAYRVVGQP